MAEDFIRHCVDSDVPVVRNPVMFIFDEAIGMPNEIFDAAAKICNEIEQQIIDDAGPVCSCVSLLNGHENGCPAEKKQ